MFSQNCMYNYYPEKNLEQKNLCFLVIIVLSTEDLCVFSKLCFFFPSEILEKKQLNRKGECHSSSKSKEFNL